MLEEMSTKLPSLSLPPRFILLFAASGTTHCTRWSSQMVHQAGIASKGLHTNTYNTVLYVQPWRRAGLG